jgi:hypothetical protein
MKGLRSFGPDRDDFIRDGFDLFAADLCMLFRETD